MAADLPQIPGYATVVIYIQMQPFFVVNSSHGR